MQKDIHNASVDRLYTTIAHLNSAEECRAFFEDLCTVKEIRDMAQRLDTAILLDAGKTYEQIAGRIGISTATISRVSRALSYGADGYRRALEEMPATEKEAVAHELLR